MAGQDIVGGGPGIPVLNQNSLRVRKPSLPHFINCSAIYE